MADLIRDRERERDIASRHFFINEEPRSEHTWTGRVLRL